MKTLIVVILLLVLPCPVFAYGEYREMYLNQWTLQDQVDYIQYPNDMARWVESIKEYNEFLC